MRLLVSVADACEARSAVTGGADIVDVKNPEEGALGAPVPATIAAVRRAVPPAIPVSAAIGDMPHLPGTAALAAVGAAHSGAAYVKVGLWASPTLEDAIVLLRAARSALADRPGVWLVAGTYADAERAPGRPLPPALLPRAAREAGAQACLLDTAVKDGRGLLEWLAPDALGALVAEAHAGGLDVALAGSLRREDLLAIRATGADIAGVRSAACLAGARTGTVEAARVEGLRAACAAT
jgi:uncharacterized protein (UPF0264 family)